MKKVAITGSLASGKSTVCSFFEQWGAYVVDADRILHDAFARCDTLKTTLVDLLGTHIIDHGVLSRQRIADSIFSNEELLYAVENVCHEVVFRAITERFQAVKETEDIAFFAAEVPLLFESRNEKLVPWFDITVMVAAPQEQARSRYIDRGGTDADFQRRRIRFMPEEEKAERATYVITNSASIEDVMHQARQVFLAIGMNSQ